MELDTGITPGKKRFLADDVPAQIKKSQAQHDPLGSEQLPLIAMHAVVSPDQQRSDWFSREELKAMSALMGKQVTGV